MALDDPNFPMSRFQALLDKINTRLDVLERPDGTQVGSLVQQVQTALANIASAITTALASGFTTGSMTATGTVTAANVNATSQLKSVGAYNTDVSLLAGARQTVWQHNTGVYGFAPSSIETKTDLGPVPFTADDVRAVQPFVFHYRAQLAIRDNPDNPSYDPSYVVPWEIGLMAEHLIEHNMGCFVFWDEDGITPRGINYDLFGAIAPLVVLADQEQRMRAAGI